VELYLDRSESKLQYPYIEGNIYYMKTTIANEDICLESHDHEC